MPDSLDGAVGSQTRQIVLRLSDPGHHAAGRIDSTASTQASGTFDGRELPSSAAIPSDIGSNSIGLRSAREHGGTGSGTASNTLSGPGYRSLSNAGKRLIVGGSARPHQQRVFQGNIVGLGPWIAPRVPSPLEASAWINHSGASAAPSCPRQNRQRLDQILVGSWEHIDSRSPVLLQVAACNWSASAP